MLVISGSVTIPDGEIELSAVRSQGPGGQHVNKVSSAVHLRFNVVESSLPPLYKARLLALRDHRLSREGVITIKVQEFRARSETGPSRWTGCAN